MSISYLTGRMQSLMNERFEILSRYAATDGNDLEEKIKTGAVVEHPAWEDLIDLENIEREMQNVSDVKCKSAVRVER